MATTTTATYNPNRGRIVQLALTDVGAIGPGVVSASQDAAPLVAHANDLLNMLLKSMDADGIATWRASTRTLTTVAGGLPYTLPDDVYDLDDPASYLPAGSTMRTPITAMSIHEWEAVSDRTSPATIPSRYFAKKDLNATGLYSITLYLWPPAANAGDTLEYIGQSKARDLNADTDTFDVSQK